MKHLLTLVVVLFFWGYAQAQVNIDSLKTIAFDEGQSEEARFASIKEICTFLRSQMSDSLGTYAMLWEKLAHEKDNPEEAVNAKLELATNQYYLGKNAKALALFHLADSMAGNASFNSGKARALKGQGIILTDLGKLPIAKEKLESGLTFAKEAKDSTAIGDILRNIGFYWHQQGIFDSALLYFLESVDVFESMGSALGMAMPLERIGEIYANKGKIDKAIETFEHSAAIWKEEENPVRIAFAYNHLGEMYEIQGAFQKAIDYYQSALRLNESVDYLPGMAGSYNNLGLVHLISNNFELSEDYFQKGHEIMRKYGNKYEIGAYLGNIGMSYTDRAEDSIGLKYILEARKLFVEVGRNREISGTSVNLGNVYDNLGEEKKAIKYYKEAMVSGEKIDCQKCIALATNNLARVYWRRGDVDQTIFYGEKGLVAAQLIGDMGAERGVSQFLAEAYKAKGQYKKSLEMFELYQSLRDSLNSIANQRATIQYEYEKRALSDSINFAKEKETAEFIYQTELDRKNLFLLFAISLGLLLAVLAIILLLNARRRKRTNFILSTQKEQIEFKNSQNELLLKEIHHRVKNNLEIVSSLLELQSAQLSDDSMRSTMLQSQSRVQSMGIIHQKLYQGESLSAIEMKEYFENLGEYLLDAFDAHDKVEVNVKMERLELDIDTAIPIGLIVNELMTNTFKYAFPEGKYGKIEISLGKISEDKLYLTVTDNGIGKNSNSVAKGTGFGGHLIHLLTRQLNGSMHESNESGTHMSFELEIVST
ncbi:MAG: tetratricopeptide repeat protein [Bacteroidia bacterium]|nr:tetratricopeptide repeat protein [Bacteroidia bacterium]